MKILVTGASGMVGRNLLADERARAHHILSPGRGELDLRDQPATDAYLERERPDLVIHLAGVVGGIQANIDAPGVFLADNLTIGLNLLRAAARAGAPRLINLGSSCMYPAGIETPLTPDLLLSGPLEPTNEGYALAKLAAWKLTQTLGREAPGAVWRTLIPPNLYGRFDHFDALRSHLIPAAVMKVRAAMASDAGEVTIWGDGQARREFMFAADLADFLWTFHDRLETLPETMNIGVGEDRTIDDYYRAVGEALGYGGRLVHDLSRPSGVRRKLLDVSAQAALGWAPKTMLADGVTATAAYYDGLSH